MGGGRERRKKKPKPSAVITTSLEQTSAQPVSVHWLAPTKTPSSLFSAEYNVAWHGKSLWSGRVSCPSCVFSQLLAQPWPISWWGQSGENENLDIMQALLSKGQRTDVLATHFSHQYKAQCHAGHTVKNVKCIPARPSIVRKYLFFNLLFFSIMWFISSLFS